MSAFNTCSRRLFLSAGGALAAGLPVLSAPALLRAATPGDTAPRAAITPQHHGARADGLSDDSPAIGRWLDHLIAHSLTGHVPAGDYLMKSPVRRRLDRALRMGILGEGSQVSRFIVPPSNRGGAFDIDAFNSRAHQLSLRGFSIIALGDSGIGLRFRMPEGGNQHQRSLNMEDVWCRGADGKTSHFREAFDFTGCWRPRLQNSGWDGPFIHVDDADSSPRFSCRTAFNLDGCYGLTVEDCHAWGCETGISSRVYQGRIAAVSRGPEGALRIRVENGPLPFSSGARVRIRGTGAYDGQHQITRIAPDTFEIDAPWRGNATGLCALELGPEGMNFKDNTINGVRTGILVERPNGREPTCWINGNHINSRDFGIVLDGVKIVQADNNNTYNEDRDNTFGGTPTDFDLRNTSEYIISGHVFHFDGHHRRVGIRVASETHGEGDNGLIHHCIFSGRFATAVHLTRQASGVIVGPNLYPGKVAQRVRDDNGTNRVL